METNKIFYGISNKIMETEFVSEFPNNKWITSTDNVFFDEIF